MRKGLQLRIYLVRLCIAFVVATSPTVLSAQVPSPSKKPADQISPPPKKLGDRISPPDKPGAQMVSPPEKPAWMKSFQHFERQLGRGSVDVARGVHLRVDNRTSGRITVHGWDRNVIEAHAFSERGEEVVISAQSEDDGSKAVFMRADYANLGSSETPTQILDAPPLGKDGPIQVHLEVNVPRYTELELIKVIRSDVEVAGVGTPITVISQSSNITLKDVGSVEAHNRTGAIIIENAEGIADVTSSTGLIKVANSRGAVRAVSIAGPIEIKCVKGRVDVGNTEAAIQLVGIDGDVEAIAASSNVTFSGPLRSDGRYYMKSMSGRVEMIVPADTRGFNAVLTSYRGKVESDFSLRPKPTSQNPDVAGHRLSGRFGNGSPQVTLDSFEGFVKLSKMASSSIVSCP